MSNINLISHIWLVGSILADGIYISAIMLIYGLICMWIGWKEKDTFGGLSE